MENKTIHIAKTEPDGTVLLKYIRGEASDAEKTCVEAWLQEDGENEKTLEQVARIYYAVRTEERIVSRNSIEAYDKVHGSMKRSIRRIWIKRVIQIAACFLGVLVMSTAISYYWLDKYNNEQSRIVTVQANKGMRVHFTLPDGSVVYLNSGSLLSYPLPYDKKERLVNLTGEAYFSITHNPKHPFIVNVKDGKMRVKVLGTEFNLQAYEGENLIQTTLVSGLVNLEVENNGHLKQQLKPSEKAIYDWNTGKMMIEKVNAMYETAWKEGKLMFKDSPLPDVLKKITHFYNVQFQIEDAVISTYRFTGTFENKQLFQVLEYLKISSNIDYKIQYAKEDDSQGEKKTVVILCNKKK